MNKITNITKRQIRSLFQNGVEVGFLQSENQRYPYSGTLEEIDFLKRLYPLDKMESFDSRFSNAEGDIYQHTINNDDYPIGWIFDDDRFPLKSGSDEDYLKFLVTVFDPAICAEGEIAKKYLDCIQNLIRKDGYEMYVSSYVSGKPVYAWRTLTDVEMTQDRFVPFSKRYEKELNNKTLIVASIPKRVRRSIIDIMTECEESIRLTTETGWNYDRLTKEATFDYIKLFYTPKAYVEEGKYEAVENIEPLIISGLPKNVIDAIEIYSTYSIGQTFQVRVNELLRSLGYQLLSNKVHHISIEVVIEQPTKDNDLKALIQEAQTFAKKGTPDDLQHAIEKLWDAFERVKTSCGNNKKTSLASLLAKITNGDNELIKSLDVEFSNLTSIGNNYKIRHFEREKKDFPSERIKQYFYDRCSSLLNLCVSFLNTESV